MLYVTSSTMNKIAASGDDCKFHASTIASHNPDKARFCGNYKNNKEKLISFYFVYSDMVD